jgi:RNA polymerase sigma factor (sigma-70 family)
MAQLQATALLDRIRDLVGGTGPADDELLRRFIGDRDEAAFARLVKRHGPMVLSVCRGVLRQQQDAEDAFQATFLVLAKSARAIQNHRSLGGWLHGVAFRVSLKSRVRAARKPAPAAIPVEGLPGETSDDVGDREVRGVVHEELRRLPDAYSGPLLLSYFEGLTRDEAARRLGITPDSFKKRLEKARNLLGERLVRRGVAPAALAGAALLSDLNAGAARAAIPVETTAKAAAAFAAGSGTVPTSATALTLAKGLVTTMVVVQWTKRAALALAIAGVTIGGGFVLQRAWAAGQGAVLQGGDGGGAIAGGGPGNAGKADDDKQRIVGVWRITDVDAPGGKTPPPEFFDVARLTFTADGKTKFSIGEESAGTYSIPRPGQIDLLAFKTQGSAEAIYAFNGDDRVKIAFREGAGKKGRPTEFLSKPGDTVIVLQLQRVGPNDKQANPKQVQAVNKVREAAARSISQNNMKQIGLAFHMHVDAERGPFPLHAIYSKDGKTPLLSWRVAILPYIEQKALFDQFKLDEPWDSQHNKALIAKMPKIYEAPFGDLQPGKTYYQVFTGKNTAHDGAKKMGLADFVDGTSNTILLAEAKDPVIWTQPVDIVVPADPDKAPAFGGLFKGGANMLFADGSVIFVNRDADVEALRALITPAGGEVVDRNRLNPQK